MNPGSDRPTILLSESKHVSENMWVVYENLCTKTREAAAAAGILTSGVTEVITGAAFKPGPKHPCQQHNPLLDSRWFSTCPERQGGNQYGIRLCDLPREMSQTCQKYITRRSTISCKTDLCRCLLFVLICLPLLQAGQRREQSGPAVASTQPGEHLFLIILSLCFGK